MARDNYIERVFNVLNDNPTSQNLDFLIEAHTAIGYMAAEAENLYDRAVDKRKYEEASAYLEAKRSGEKLSDKAAEAMAQVKCWDYRTAESEAKVKAQKVKNLLESLTQAINAIKFLGRYDSPIAPPITTPERR